MDLVQCYWFLLVCLQNFQTLKINLKILLCISCKLTFNSLVFWGNFKFSFRKIYIVRRVKGKGWKRKMINLVHIMQCGVLLLHKLNAVKSRIYICYRVLIWCSEISLFQYAYTWTLYFFLMNILLLSSHFTKYRCVILMDSSKFSIASALQIFSRFLKLCLLMPW